MDMILQTMLFVVYHAFRGNNWCISGLSKNFDVIFSPLENSYMSFFKLDETEAELETFNTLSVTLTK